MAHQEAAMILVGFDLAVLPCTVVVSITLSVGELSARRYLADSVFLNRQRGTGRRERGTSLALITRLIVEAANPPNRFPLRRHRAR
jgi:hypothetical protein